VPVLGWPRPLDARKNPIGERGEPERGFVRTVGPGVSTKTNFSGNADLPGVSQSLPGLIVGYKAISQHRFGWKKQELKCFPLTPIGSIHPDDNNAVAQGGPLHEFFDKRAGHVGWHSRLPMDKRSIVQHWLCRM